MTCREKLTLEHPDDVREDSIGGCVATMPYIESETMICQSCILCGESMPVGGPMICDSCRDLWTKLKEENA
jgi:hypothetical protein